jgi:hypothetical protein
MFKKGDKYIHFTKYGGVNKGEVADIHTVIVWDTDNCCTFEKISILTTKGFSLCLDGTDGKIFKINSEFSKERAKALSKGIKKIANRKHRPEDLSKIHIIDED